MQSRFFVLVYVDEFDRFVGATVLDEDRAPVDEWTGLNVAGFVVWLNSDLCKQSQVEYEQTLL